MATLGGTVLTLAEVAKRTDPDGMPAKIAETLHQTNRILDDIPFSPSNLPTSHRSTIRTGLPTVSLRRVNEGVASTRSTTAQVVDGMSRLEAWSTCDTMLMETALNPAAVRMQEATAFVESMGIKAAELLFYGDEADDNKEFNGLSQRYALTTGATGDNVLDCAGTSGTDHSSIWLIGWGNDKIHGIYPRGSQGGLRHIDRGIQTEQTSTSLGGTKLLAYEDVYCWDMGLVVKDWRYAVRMANIEVSDLTTLLGSGTQGLTDYASNILFQMATALHRIPNLNACKPCFYMNRTVFEGFDRIALANTTANVFKSADVDGEIVTTFRGVPMKICDQILNTESAIS